MTVKSKMRTMCVEICNILLFLYGHKFVHGNKSLKVAADFKEGKKCCKIIMRKRKQP